MISHHENVRIIFEYAGEFEVSILKLVLNISPLPAWYSVVLTNVRVFSLLLYVVNIIKLFQDLLSIQRIRNAVFYERGIRRFTEISACSVIMVFFFLCLVF